MNDGSSLNFIATMKQLDSDGRKKQTTNPKQLISNHGKRTDNPKRPNIQNKKAVLDSGVVSSDNLVDSTSSDSANSSGKCVSGIPENSD